MKGRIEELVHHVADRTRIWRSMEEMTGVNARTWQNAVRGHQRPTAGMIEAIGRVWPQYAFWIVTGKTDQSHGHTSPILERIARDVSKVQEG